MTKILSGLLAFQVLIAGAIYYSNQQQVSFDTERPLLEFEVAAVDKIVIEGEGDSALIEKKDGQWVLPDLHALPVNQAKLESALENLTTAKAGWPVASSTSSHERLEVAEANFQRKLSVDLSDGSQKHVYMGTSPGYRSIHARTGRESDIYNVKLAKFDFPVLAADWLDRSLLSLDKFNRIQLGERAVERVESDWQFVDQSVVHDKAATINTDQVSKLAGLIEEMSVLNVAESTPEFTHSIDLVVTSGAQSWTYKFTAVDDKQYVRRSDRDITFEISKHSFDIASRAKEEGFVLESQPIADETEDSTESNGNG